MSSKSIYPKSPKDYSGPKVTNLETFIQKAQFVHGDAYSYDKSEYVNARSKITITCPIHGDFEQTPSGHLNGDGCSQCRYDSQKSNTEEFIEQAKVVHGEKYSYDKAVYTNAHTKLIITCPIHGDFEQIPTGHLGGKGCPECHSDSKRSNTAEFIQKAQFVHDNKYSYNKTEYVNTRTKITITCEAHGDFQQTPTGHLGGNGCPKCANESCSGRYDINK